MHPDDILMLILLPGLLLTCAWLVWLITTNVRRARTARQQAELQSKLLDKLGSSQDLVHFLDSKAGQQMLRVTSDQADPAGRVLNAMQIGVVLVTLGIGFLTCEGSLPGAPSTGLFLALGILSLSLGAGFLIASALSFVLTRAWGMLPRAGAPLESAPERPLSSARD